MLEISLAALGKGFASIYNDWNENKMIVAQEVSRVYVKLHAWDKLYAQQPIVI